VFFFACCYLLQNSFVTSISSLHNNILAAECKEHTQHLVKVAHNLCKDAEKMVENEKKKKARQPFYDFELILFK